MGLVVVATFLALVGLAQVLETSVWPERRWADCERTGHAFIDFVAGARGPSTVEQALVPYRTPGSHLVRSEHRADLGDTWQVVDDQGIEAQLGVLADGHGGWLVHEVEACAGIFHPVLGPAVTPIDPRGLSCPGLLSTGWRPPRRAPQDLTLDPRSGTVEARWLRPHHIRLAFLVDDPKCLEVPGLRQLAKHARAAHPRTESRR